MVKQTATNTLFIDVGNSSVKIKKGSDPFSTTKKSKKGSDPFSAFSSQLYPEDITVTFFTELWRKIEKPENILVSCVAKNQVWQALVDSCHELWQLDIQRVESLSEGYGLINGYDNASDLGSDRWCAMIAAQHITNSAFIVVDAGSALTLDIVNKSGHHLGGYITPGLRMMNQSLGLHTAQVQVATRKSLLPSLSLGRSTTDCVEAGTYLSAVSLIESVFKKESQQLKELQCYITGGDAKLIADLLSFKCVIIADLVLRGLAEIQKNNQE